MEVGGLFIFIKLIYFLLTGYTLLTALKAKIAHEIIQ